MRTFIGDVHTNGHTQHYTHQCPPHHTYNSHALLFTDAASVLCVPCVCTASSGLMCVLVVCRMVYACASASVCGMHVIHCSEFSMCVVMLMTRYSDHCVALFVAPCFHWASPPWPHPLSSRQRSPADGHAHSAPVSGAPLTTLSPAKYHQRSSAAELQQLCVQLHNDNFTLFSIFHEEIQKCPGRIYKPKLHVCNKNTTK